MSGPRDARRLAVRRLNEALVDELVRSHLGRGPRPGDRRHADLIAERIVRLGGAPDYSSLRLALRLRSPARRPEPTRA